jgi:hypothetical protein
MRNILIGLIVVALVAGGFYLLKGRASKNQLQEETPSVASTTESKIKNRFMLEIPDDVEKAELKDVSGGESYGVATRKFESGVFTHTVLADLSTPESGFFYEGWLVRGKQGDADFDFFSTGKMRIAKGGYLLEFSANIDYPEYKGVVITLEKTEDKKPETHILEGSF